ncbi:hypothetical protein WG926_24575 [Tistrella sp. BH-R2-4]|uniref:Integron cassette protein VCH-CASS1 chain domain-containing protein n=1 Tax=Tistrella arctica TaxID=3133430 RepID=A0ABU9YRT8_9PROT
MAIRLTTDADIDAFIVRIIDDANHHGRTVNMIIQPLSDEVRKYLDLRYDTVYVYTREGNMGRACWVTIKGKRYAFSYNHTDQNITLRLKNMRGTVQFSFDNNSTAADIVREVANL